MPKVSIILTSFNHAKYLRDAIESVLNQTFKDFELIIWDDASIDDSWEIIQSYKDSRIIALRNDVQQRGIHNINKAIKEIAQAEYIAIHHSDDIWETQKLEKQVAFLDDHDKVGAVFTKVHIIDEFSNPFTDDSHFYVKIFDQPNRTRHAWLRFFFERGNALCHPSVLIRKRCYDDCGLYRYGLAQLGDFDMWVRLTLKYEIFILPEKLVGFRVRDNEANSSGNRPVTRSRDRYEHSLVIKNFHKIDDIEDLISIFPEAKKYCNGEMPVLQYALAMAMLEIRPHQFVLRSALDVLFQLINDPKLKTSIKFNGVDFVNLTGELDPLQVLHLENLYRTTNEQDIQLTQLRQAMSALENQISQLRSGSQSLSRLESRLNEINPEFQKLTGHIVDFINTANESNSVIERLNQVLDELNAKITGASGGSESFSSLESRLNEMGPDLQKLTRHIISLINRSNEQDGNIVKLNQTLNELTQKTTELSEWGAHLQATLVERERQVEELTDEIIKRAKSTLGLDVELKVERERVLALQRSHSWMITKPLRELMRWINHPQNQLNRYVTLVIVRVKRSKRFLDE